MPPRDSNHDLRRTPRLGVAIVCLAALMSPAAVFSSHDAYAAGKPSASGAVADSDEQGLRAFGMDGVGVNTAFESLSRVQRARVMQRCKDVMAKPVQANPDKLALCQTLMPMANQ